MYEHHSVTSLILKVSQTALLIAGFVWISETFTVKGLDFYTQVSTFTDVQHS